MFFIFAFLIRNFNFFKFYIRIRINQTDVEEFPIDLLSVTVAQRYSVLVTARNDTSSNWAIHANMDSDMFDKIPPDLNPSLSPFVFGFV